jgi:hypothetical protein
VSAVVSVSVVAGAYWTVTTQLLAGASVVALQVSSPEGIENALDPVGLKDAVSVVEVPVPELVRVKLWVGVLPEVTDPKLYGEGDHPSDGVPALPESERLALAWVAVAVRVALSVSPAVVGAYFTVTVHDCPGPRLIPTQLSAVIVKGGELDRVTFLIAPEALSFEAVRTNVTELVAPAPASSVPNE